MLLPGCRSGNLIDHMEDNHDKLGDAADWTRVASPDAANTVRLLDST